MSFSSSRKNALDIDQPIKYRVSCARSCAVCVCEKLKVKRSVVIDEVLLRCGVDLYTTGNSDEIIKAIDMLEYLRFNGI